MRVSIGDLFASCVKCGGDDFHPASRNAQLLRERSYVCAGCHASYLYSDLLMQMSEKALKQSRDRDKS